MPLERIPVPSQREIHEALRRFYEQYTFEEDEEKKRRTTKKRRRSRVSILISVLVGGAGSWSKVPVALTAAGAPSRTTNRSSWVLLPVPGAGKIYWGHGAAWRFTSAVPGQVICSLLLGSRGDSTGAVLDKVYMPVVVSGAVSQTVQNTVENPQSQFWDKVFMPVVVASGAYGQTAQELWRFHSSSSWTRCSCLLLLVWCRWPDSPVNCGGPPVAVLRSCRFPCRAAETDLHGLTCPEDHRGLRSCSMFPGAALGQGVACPLLCMPRVMVQTVQHVSCTCSSWTRLTCRRGASTGAEFSRQFFPPSSAHRCEYSRALGWR